MDSISRSGSDKTMLAFLPSEKDDAVEGPAAFGMLRAQYAASATDVVLPSSHVLSSFDQPWPDKHPHRSLTGYAVAVTDRKMDPPPGLI
jgi:hypothetical protein